MEISVIKVGARFQKAGPSRKVFRVISSVKPTGQPAHARLVAESDSTHVITVAVSALIDSQFWLPVSSSVPEDATAGPGRP